MFLLAIYFIFLNENKTKTTLAVIGLLALTPVILLVARNLFNIYGGYFELTTMDVGFLILVKLAVCAVYILTNLDNFRLKASHFAWERILTSIYVAGLLLTSLAYFFAYMGRVGLLFMLFEPVFWARLCKTSKHRLLYVFFVLALGVFVVYTNYISNGHGVFPYEWIL